MLGLLQATPQLAKKTEGVIDQLQLQVKATRDEDEEERFIRLVIAKKGSLRHITVMLGKFQSCFTTQEPSAILQPIIMPGHVAVVGAEGAGKSTHTPVLGSLLPSHA